jgi:hypothetical protein
MLFVAILFNLYNEYCTNGSLEISGDLKITGQVISTVLYAD